MKSKIFYILILIIGIIILAYPVISNKLAEKTETDLIVKYNDEVEKISQEDVEQMKKEASTYNKELNSQEKITSNYIDLLRVGEIIGYVDIPKINVYLPIYQGTSDYVLSKGVGHVESTSLPVGGSSTHSVLAAHTGFSRATLFSNLNKIQLEDTFYIHILDESLKYKVEEIKTIDPENVEDVKSLEVQEGRDLVTLMTCSRIGVNKYRLLVTGSRIEDNQEINLQEDFKENSIQEYNENEESLKSNKDLRKKTFIEEIQNTINMYVECVKQYKYIIIIIILAIVLLKLFLVILNKKRR